MTLSDADAPNPGPDDLCPCGSGRKHKDCCLGRAQKGPQGQLSDALAHLKQALAGQPFDDIENMQAFADDFTRERNRQPLDDFHGLSPDQMHRLLNFPFESPDVLVFAERLDHPPEAPIATLFGLLADALDGQGLKPTDKGFLPRNFCRETALAYLGEDGYREHTRFGGINRETDFPDLHKVRMIAELAGMIRKHRGRFILSRDARALLADAGQVAIYPLLLRTGLSVFNWGYEDRYPELPIIQQSFAFTLYLLHRYGDTERPHTFYEDAFLRAFPAALGEIDEALLYGQSKEDMLRSCYTLRTLVRTIGFFGLAEVRPLGDRMFDREYLVKKTNLFDGVIRWAR